jgi:hypothetical protein
MRQLGKPPHNGIGLPIAEEPSHTTARTDRVYGGSAGISITGCELSHWLRRVFSEGSLSVFQRLLQYTNKNISNTDHIHLPVPFEPGTVRAFTGVSHLKRLTRRQLSPSRWPRLLCPLLTSPIRSRWIAPPSAKIPSHATSQRAHGRPPGVNTRLSVHGRRVYGHCL